MAALLLSAASLNANSTDKRLDIYWVDVEGGAATLIVTPENESILIDTGNPGVRDSGRIIEAAKGAGLTRIDHLFISHFHIDHFGGAAEVAKGIPIGTVYDKGVPEKNPDNNPNDRTFLLTIKPYKEMQADKRVVIKAGDDIPLRQTAGGVPLKLRCLAAQKQISKAGPDRANTLCGEGRTKEEDPSDNANSVVLVLEFGGFRFFNGGDLTWNIEQQLVCPVNVVGTVDVYQVTHHGLDVSNNPLVLRTLAPTVSVMSNGTQKGCGAETMATLKSVKSIEAMYQIHKNLRAPQDNTVEEQIANLEAKCKANSIKLSVDPSAQTYTVSIPATGHSRSFKTRKHQ